MSGSPVRASEKWSRASSATSSPTVPASISSRTVRELRMVAVHERLGQVHAGGLDRRLHPVQLLAGDDQRLLAEDVLAGLRRPHDPGGVQRVGQRDVDGVDVGVGQQLLVRVVGLRDAQFGGVRAGPPTRAADRDDLPAPRTPDTGNDLLAGDAGGAEHAPTDVVHVLSFCRLPVRTRCARTRTGGRSLSSLISPVTAWPPTAPQAQEPSPNLLMTQVTVGGPGSGLPRRPPRREDSTPWAE